MSLIICRVCGEHGDGTELCCATCYDDIRKQLAAVTENLRKTHKDYGFEIRDPNSTIWKECARLQKELAAAQESESRFRSEVAAGFSKHGLAAGPEAIDGLVRDLAAAQARIAELESVVNIQTATINSMNNALYMRDQRIAELEKQINAMKRCSNCQYVEAADPCHLTKDQEARRRWTVKRLTLKQFEEILVVNRLVDPAAIEDPQGYDNYATKDKICIAYNEIKEELKDEEANPTKPA